MDHQSWRNKEIKPTEELYGDEHHLFFLLQVQQNLVTLVLQNVGLNKNRGKK